jgi:hypothetical protein
LSFKARPVKTRQPEIQVFVELHTLQAARYEPEDRGNMIAPRNSEVTDMGRLRTILIYAAGALTSGIAIGFIEYPDSLFVYLSAVMAAYIISSMLRMCDRLLDPPSAIFLIFTRRKIISRFSAHVLTSSGEQSKHTPRA